ncbi:MAG: ABC transporter substrate-binding protein [Candidatus Bipolaricaulia bacterium]
MRSNWRFGVVFLSLVLVVGLFAGAQQIKNPSIYIHATISGAETMDPAFSYDTASATAIFNVYETLIFYKGSSVTDFDPMLATSWEVSADGLTYRFPIRQGVRFHNGARLTPEDVEYSFERTLIQDRSGGPVWILLEPLLGVGTIEDLALEIAEGMGETVEEFSEISEAALRETFNRVDAAVEVEGDNVVFRLTQPFAPFLSTLLGNWGSIVNRDWVIGAGGWPGTVGTWVQYHDPQTEESVLYNRMNGTGPFKLERFVPQEEVVLIRNDDYWREPAQVERAIIKYVDEWSTRLLMLQNGDADSIWVPRQFITQVQPLVDQGVVDVFTDLPAVSLRNLFFNYNVIAEGNPYIGSGQLDGNGIPPNFFSDINVRKGFAYSFDPDIFIQDVYFGEAKQVTGPIPEGLPFFDENAPLYGFDPEKAEEHFRAAWGGQLWDNGFQLTILYNTGNVERRVAAEMLEFNIEALNPKFQIDIQDVAWPTYIGSSVRNQLPVFIIGWLEDYHDPHNWVVPYMASFGTFVGWQGIGAEGLAEIAKERYDR